MGQDWKTLSLVIIGAAIIGWWTMRSLTGDANRVASQPVARATMPAPPERPVKTVAERPPAAEPAPPAKIPGALATPDADAASGADESAVIVRDLASLTQGLVYDLRIEDHVMPRVNDALDVPGITQYRRAPDFWESALGGQAEAKP